MLDNAKIIRFRYSNCRNKNLFFYWPKCVNSQFYLQKKKKKSNNAVEIGVHPRLPFLICSSDSIQRCLSQFQTSEAFVQANHPYTLYSIAILLSINASQHYASMFFHPLNNILNSRCNFLHVHHKNIKYIKNRKFVFLFYFILFSYIQVTSNSK